ncbi:MAG TPA: hypothetical protein DDY78_04510 [Planctomycetales bacterium]|nr:hypothetical protein [Planctomycetales bacterium]
MLVVHSGCGKPTKAVNSGDAICLAGLAPYHDTHKIDENGRVIEVTLEGRQVDDAALIHLQNLSELRRLSLYGSSITDEGLTKLSGLKYLEGLGLGKTQITDHGLIHLEKMPSLHWVWLTEDPQITDQAVENLKKKALPGLTVYR